MNVRKYVDYCDMYEKLDDAMTGNLSQVELYHLIGKSVCDRYEKGAVVAAAEYLKVNYPNVRGFSPQNLRRMRAFHPMYEAEPILQCVGLSMMNYTLLKPHVLCYLTHCE